MEENEIIEPVEDVTEVVPEEPQEEVIIEEVPQEEITEEIQEENDLLIEYIKKQLEEDHH